MSTGAGGYRGICLDLLTSNRLSVGDRVVIETSSGKLTGVIMPRYESASDQYISIKLKSGYNTGVLVGSIKSITRVPQKEPDVIPRHAPIKENESLPRIALISTGGTIASRIDYRTGGVRAALSAEDLYSSVPELADVAWVNPEVLMSEYSENLMPRHWTAIAERVAERVRSGDYQGIVVSHGTDTMHYTAAALSFALQDLPIPVVLVGAQRSSDRPSSDAAINLIGATLFATKATVAGVFVAMHASTSDDAVAIHVGTRVRKNHTSRRDAFESIDSTPVARVLNGQLEMIGTQFTLSSRDENRQLRLQSRFDERVLLLKYYPGLDFKIVDYAKNSGFRAIVLEGTGLGHVNRGSIESLRNAISSGMLVFMTSQCIWGRVRMTVYDTGRDLLDIGVIPLSDMISETATVKAMWALANSPDPKSVASTMTQNIANEISNAIPISE